MIINIDSLNINYTDEGEGNPILFLHGWGSSSDAFRGIIRALGAGHRYIAPDLPGCGKSDTMKEPWTLDDYCNFVFKFITALGIENPIMIGHSNGGRITLKMTATGMIYPDKAVLIDSAGLIPKKPVSQKLRSVGFKTIKKVLTLPVIREHSEGMLESARNHFGSADYNAAPPVLRKTLVNLVNTDLSDILPGIKASTLLIWGENDTATPLSDGEKISSLIPDSGLCKIKNAGHFPFVDKPYEVYAILNSFLH